MALVGLVLGILSLVGGSVPVVNTFPMWLFGIAGIIVSSIARKKEKSLTATIGSILSVIGTALALSVWVACLTCVGAAGLTGILENFN
jgi:hypothetical protein